MRATITISTKIRPDALEVRLAELAGASPFRIGNLTRLCDSGRWAMTLQPLRPGLSIGFAKLAELLVLLAREFQVDTVERITLDAAPVAPAAGATPHGLSNT